jgi:hypothetical protein
MLPLVNRMQRRSRNEQENSSQGQHRQDDAYAQAVGQSSADFCPFVAPTFDLGVVSRRGERVGEALVTTRAVNRQRRWALLPPTYKCVHMEPVGCSRNGFYAVQPVMSDKGAIKSACSLDRSAILDRGSQLKPHQQQYYVGKRQ